MKLEVGKAYRTQGGWKAILTYFDETEKFGYFSNNDSSHENCWHDENGKAEEKDESYDLIAPWEEETEQQHANKMYSGMVDQINKKPMKPFVAGDCQSDNQYIEELRDRAALASLQGQLACRDHPMQLDGFHGQDPKFLVNTCYRIADAFIAARKAKEE